MKISLTLLEKLLGVLLVLLQQINRIIEKDDDKESNSRKADVAIADAVRSKFPTIVDEKLLAEIAKANGRSSESHPSSLEDVRVETDEDKVNEVTEIIDRV